MCGRYTISKTKEEVVQFIQDHFEVENIQDFHLPRYNIGPGQEMVALLYDGQKYRVGLISWDYRIKVAGKLKQVINARSETIDQKYSFRRAFQTKRCLILADGFYEWDQLTKQPYRILKKDKGLYFYAGIYDAYTKDETKKYGALIVTTSANDILKEHHHRMPVMLDPDEAKSYLDPSLRPDEVKWMLKAYPEEKMMIYPVSRQVNSVQNDDIECIKKTTID